MRVAQEKVAEFHDKYGYENPDAPAVGDRTTHYRRFALIKEELEEYLLACEQGDLVEIADAVADLAYVVVGTAVAHGLPLQALFDEVHRSNMTKDPDPGTGKPSKGPRFERPAIAAVLLATMKGVLDEVQ